MQVSHCLLPDSRIGFPWYEFLTSGMPCDFANASALSRLRAATARTMTSGCDLAGMIRAIGLPVVSMETGPTVSPGNSRDARSA